MSILCTSTSQEPARTLPGTNLRDPEAKGANLTSTCSRAFGLKGALGGVGFGPYLRASALVRVFKSLANLSREDIHSTKQLSPASLDVRRSGRSRDQPGLQICNDSQYMPCMTTIEPVGTHRWVGPAMAADRPVSVPMSTRPAAAPRPLRTRELMHLRVRYIVVGLAPASSGFFRVRIRRRTGRPCFISSKWSRHAPPLSS